MSSQILGLDTLNFWQALDELVATSEVIIDRPLGSTHPRFPAYVYPLHYGYLKGTTASDGDGMDVWGGTLEEQRVTGVIVTIDLQKRDSEIKVLLGCTADEMQMLLRDHNRGLQSGMLIDRPAER